MPKPIITFLFLIAWILLPCTGCNVGKDYSPRTGSYQAENLKTDHYLQIIIYREGVVTPKFYLGTMTLLHGDYRALLRMDNPTFSEEILMEVLDENKKTINEYELHFMGLPEDDDPQVEILARQGVKRRHLTVDKIVIPYDERMAWLKMKKQYIRFNYNKVVPDTSNYQKQLKITNPSLQ